MWRGTERVDARPFYMTSTKKRKGQLGQKEENCLEYGALIIFPANVYLNLR